MNVEEYSCLDCGHTFPSHTPVVEECCPRCLGPRLETNPWLLRTPSAMGLSQGDYEALVEVKP